MRATSIAAFSAIAVLAASAVAQAQTAPPGGMGIGTAPRGAVGSAGAPSAQRPPLPNPLTLQDVSKITGSEVYGNDDKRIGSISTELMKPSSKEIDRLVVSTGGVLGVGAHYVAIPIDKFAWDPSKEAFTLASTADDLKTMPQYQEQTAGVPDAGATAPLSPAPSATAPEPATPAATTHE